MIMLLKTFDQNIILFNYLKVLVVRLPLLRLVLHLPIPVFCLFLFSLLLPFIVFSFSLPLSLFVVYSQSLMLLDDLLFFDRLAAFYLVFLPCKKQTYFGEIGLRQYWNSKLFLL